MGKPVFSIIIPTYNRLEKLSLCLQSIERQSFKDWECIVINDGSSDETSSFLDQFTKKNKKILTVQLGQNQGPSAARNAGAAKAHGELLAFIDDDCIADANWLKKLASTFSINSGTDFFIGKTVYVREGYTGKFPERIVENPNANWPMTCNLAWRKSSFEKLGGFDSLFDPFHNEDTELGIRALSQGQSYLPCKDAKVFHQADEWTKKNLLASAKNAGVWVILRKKYPRHFKSFGGPTAFQGYLIHGMDYLYLLLSPLLIPLLLIRFYLNGKRNFKLFFTKWPLLLIHRRFWIWKLTLN